jgi:NAD(P) transhydrogenase subunit alpha
MCQRSFPMRHVVVLLTALFGVLALLGCGRLDPPPVEPAQKNLLADSDIDDADGSPAVVEEQTAQLLDTPQEQADGWSREQTLITSLTIFVLAVFVGFEVITKVPPTLHTPLMSGSNAISGITVVGAALMAGNVVHRGAMVFGVLAVILATINVVGGFLVTDRMLGMFKKR